MYVDFNPAENGADQDTVGHSISEAKMRSVSNKDKRHHCLKLHGEGGTQILVLYACMTKGFQSITLIEIGPFQEKHLINKNFTEFLRLILLPKQSIWEHIWWNRGV